MRRRSLLALLATSLALPVTGTFAQDAPRQLTAEEIALINEISAHNSGITTMAGRFLQIDTQGIAEGKPFSQAIEARRVGGC